MTPTLSRRGLLSALLGGAAAMTPAAAMALHGLPAAPDVASMIDRIILAGRPYWLPMVGDSMRPCFDPGDELYLDPALPPKIGDDHVWFDEDRNAIVGRLVEMSPATWHIEQWRWQGKYFEEIVGELPRSDWPTCHRITEVWFV